MDQLKNTDWILKHEIFLILIFIVQKPNELQHPAGKSTLNDLIKETCLAFLELEIFRKWAIKLGKIYADRAEATPSVSEEWGSGWTGTNFIVEIEETASAPIPRSVFPNSSEEFNDTTTINGTSTVHGPKIIVRTEEVLIVGLVLLLWVGAIMLFFNRWGKIRMLEPYQPKFIQQHRSSCPLVDTIPTHGRASVSRMSMGMVNNVNCQFATCSSGFYSKGYAPPARPRQNSVFVGPSPSQFLMPRPPRKTRSAMDLHSMVLDETAEAV